VRTLWNDVGFGCRTLLRSPGYKAVAVLTLIGINQDDKPDGTGPKANPTSFGDRPRRTWLDATCPVYVDLGDDLLAKLEIYDESGLPCIRLVAKQKLIHDAMTEKAATAIATRFYPLPPSGPPRG
jgi:hypothetical protein